MSHRERGHEEEETKKINEKFNSENKSVGQISVGYTTRQRKSHYKINYVCLPLYTLM